MLNFSEKDKAIEVDAHEKKGRVRKPLTYLNVLRWFIKGIGITLVFFGWTIWKYLGIGIWKLLGFLLRFAWHLLLMVHSSKRTLCAINGTLGGAATYLWLASPGMTLSSQVLLVLFGGVLGAALGVAHFEFVSKRLLQVHKSD